MKLHHVALTVKDLNISIPFYQNLFGFAEFKRFRRDDLNATGVFLQSESIIIELWQFDTFKKGSREDLEYTGIKHIAFTHDNLEELRNSFTEKGIDCKPIREGKSGGSYFFLADPDENQIEIYKPD
jgi:glyoxylase I family protein